MSVQFCSCDGTLLNTGLASKNSVVNDGTKIIMVPLRADDGTFNEILLTDTIDDTYINDKLTGADKSKRWYPVGDFRNVTDERADPTTETYSDGSSAVTVQGIRSFVGWLVGAPASYGVVLDAWKCASFGIFTVDDCGSLAGSLASNGALRPIKVNPDSWYAGNYNKGSDTLKAKQTLQFEFSQQEKDKALRVIPSSLIQTDLTEIIGLYNVFGTVTAPLTTGFTITLRTEDGTFAGVPVAGFTDSDFTVFNVTTNSAITLTSATEAPEGTYAIVYDAPVSSADVIRVSALKDNFELPAQEFTTP